MNAFFLKIYFIYYSS